RKRSLFETEHEDDVELARARAAEVDDRNAALLVAARQADRCTLERRVQLFASERAVELAPPGQLVEQLPRRLVDREIATRRLADGRRLDAVRGAEHPA